jgi:hypothetical protein
MDGFGEGGERLRAIYVHYDGFPDAIMPRLTKDYADAADARALFGVTGYSSLRETPDASEPYHTKNEENLTMNDFLIKSDHHNAQYTYVGRLNKEGGVNWELIHCRYMGNF